MATLYAAADGQLVFHAGLRGSVPVPPPPTATQSLEFDPETNPGLVVDLRASWQLYRLTAGVLTRDGVVVTLNPPSQFTRDKQQIDQAAAQLDALLAKLDGGTDLTAAERQAAFRFILRALRFILRWIRSQ